MQYNVHYIHTLMYTITFALLMQSMHSIWMLNDWLIGDLYTLYTINFFFRDAEDAVNARDGYDYDGYRLRVEFPKGGGGSFRKQIRPLIIIKIDESNIIFSF